MRRMDFRSRLILLPLMSLLLLQPACATPWPFRAGANRSANTTPPPSSAASPAQFHSPPPQSPYSPYPPPNPSQYSSPQNPPQVPATQAGDQPPTDPRATQFASFTPPGAAGNADAPHDDLPPDGSSSFTPAQIIAIVGNQYILYGDIEGIVNLIMAVNLAKLPPEEVEQHKDEIAAQKQLAIRANVEQEIQTKLVYLDFMRTIPRDKVGDFQKKVDDAFQREFEDVRQKVLTADDEQAAKLARSNPVLVRMALMMKKQELETLGQLDLYLRGFGSSLDKQKRAYGEFMLAQMMIGRNIKQNVEITHEQMLQYYRDHAADYAVPAKARWEQLTVRFDRFPSKEEAHRALAEMGNQVYLGGAPLAAVAKRGSQEPNADQGGYHDWTAQASLASQTLDDAIFSLPINRLSQIIEDQRGYHILRVLERTEATSVPFTEAQGEIKDKIKMERRQQDVKTYLESLQKNTTVWRYFDDAKEPVTSAAPSRDAGRAPPNRR